METIISKGKNIKEAIETGLTILGVQKNKVTIEVIQKETKSFLGLKSKEAVVKITRNDQVEETGADQKISEGTNDPFERLNQLIEEIPMTDFPQKEKASLQETPKTGIEKKGKAWIKEGRLYCQTSKGEPPLVTVSKNIQLYQNNELVKEKTIAVSEFDDFEIKLEQEEQKTIWEIKVDAQKLRAEIDIQPGYQITRSIADAEPSSHLELKAEEQKVVSNTLTYSDVMAELKKLQVKYGLHQNEIIRATEASESGVFTIASGVEPTPGKDGWVELQTDTETKTGLLETEKGRIDYREIRMIPSVESGEVIAIVHPPVPGQPGRTVTDEPIFAEQTNPVSVKAGKGISFIEDKVIAAKPGRPHFEQRRSIALFSIMSKLTHAGNVNLESGNLSFKGDIEVTGEISERMKVEAEGDIMVHQSINGSFVTAGGTIIAKGGISGSEITAGKNDTLTSELSAILQPINLDLKRIIQLINQLVVSPGFKAGDFSRSGLQPLLHILLEKKFKDFPSVVKQYVEGTAKAERYLTDTAWSETAARLAKIFLYASADVISMEQIQALSKKIDELCEFNETSADLHSCIHAANVLSSRLHCGGDVFIQGESCVNTNIYAGGKIEIAGALRGGEIFGRLGVKVKEAGAESRTPTLIAVPEDQQIQLGYAFEGTTMIIGQKKYTFANPGYSVLAYLDQQGQILFGKGGR